MPRATAECHCAYYLLYDTILPEGGKKDYIVHYIQHPYMLSFRLHRVWIEWAVGGE